MSQYCSKGTCGRNKADFSPNLRIIPSLPKINSSREDIYMVQKLMIHDREITQKEKGIWCMPGMEGTQFDLTQTILNYQKLRVNPLNTTPLFVTGYYDIYTEASILKEVGEDTYGIFGL